MSAPAGAKEAIREHALALGFDAVGFAPAALADEARRNLTEFLRLGYHGDMGWLAARAASRADPRTLWSDARSVVVVAMNYGPEEDPLTAQAERRRGAVSVYARGRDYHDDGASLAGNDSSDASCTESPDDSKACFSRSKSSLTSCAGSFPMSFAKAAPTAPAGGRYWSSMCTSVASLPRARLKWTDPAVSTSEPGSDFQAISSLS